MICCRLRLQQRTLQQYPGVQRATQTGNCMWKGCEFKRLAPHPVLSYIFPLWCQSHPYPNRRVSGSSNRLTPRSGGEATFQSSAPSGHVERRCRTTTPRTTQRGGRARLRCQATARGGGSAQTAVSGTGTASATADSSREAPMSPTGTATPLPRPPMMKGEVGA